MTKNRDDSPGAADLRRRAEEWLRAQQAQTGLQPPTAEEALRLVHELQVHHIELGMQNEALRETQALLERNLERYTDLYDFAPVGYFTVTADGTIRELNLAGAALLGLERFRLISRRFGSFVSQQTRLDFVAFLERVLAGTTKEHCEIAFDREGMPPCCAHLEGVGLRDGEERLCRIAAMDITDRKQAEIALQESEARLQRVLDGTNDGVWDWNVVTGEVWFSRRWAEMLGYEPAEIEPHVRSWERLVHPADMPAVQAALQAHLCGVTPQYQSEHRLRAKNGEWRWILDRGKAAARDAEGRPLWMSGTHTDITDRKTADLALLAARRDLLAQQDHLEEQVARRTAELAAALDAAEAAGRAKSAFLANMSHEIHTPINAIVGLIYLLRRRVSDPDQSDKLNKIADATRDLLALLDGVLDLARLDADRVVLERVAFAPETLVREICDRLQPQAQAKHLNLRLELDPDLARYPVLYGDPARLGQLLVNYLDNAIKFSEHGAVVLRGRVVEERTSGVLLHFEVRDEGPGITPDVLPRLFAAFQQVDSSATRHYGGIGLGLALNRQLARLMGGEVGAESTLGTGSTFWCTVRFETKPPAAA